MEEGYCWVFLFEGRGVKTVEGGYWDVEGVGRGGEFDGWKRR